MRKLFRSLLVMLAFLMSSCATKDDINKLQSEIDLLKSDKIASVESQLSSIKSSISKMETADTELKGYIDKLQKQHDELAKASSELSESAEALKGESAGLDLLLDVFKTGLDSKLSSFQSSLSALETKAGKLEEQMSSLQSYSEELKKSKEWVSSTFATLEQNTQVTATLAGIQTTVSGVKSSVEALGKSWESDKGELYAQVDSLSHSSGALLKKAIEDTDKAISTSKSEVENAYTSALAEAIGAFSLSLKTWVNTQLSGYYTIAAADAAMEDVKARLQADMDAQKVIIERLLAYLADRDSSVDKESEGVISNLGTEISQMVSANQDTFKSIEAEIEAASKSLMTDYKAAVKSAIENYNGQIDDKLKSAVNKANKDMATKLNAVRDELTAMDVRLTACEKSIQRVMLEVAEVRETVAQILSGVQRMDIIPTYGQKKVAMMEGYADVLVSIFPESAAAALADADPSVFSYDAIAIGSTQTVASFINIPIKSIKASEEGLVVKVDGSTLPADFYSEKVGLSARFKIKDRGVELTTDFVALQPVVEYVDLGLSVKWASFDLGAESPEGLGDYYRWGEIEPGLPVEDLIESFKDYKWCNGTYYTMTRYCTNILYGEVDYLDILKSEDDVASVVKGGKWRIPTIAEWNELQSKCDFSTCEIAGRTVYKVTSKNNHRFIYLNMEDYWSSVLTYIDCDSAYSFNGTNVRSAYLRIRPVLGDPVMIDTTLPALGNDNEWNW